MPRPKAWPLCKVSTEWGVVVGILTFVWYWVGHEWTYLQEIPRGDWKPAWILFTLVALVICRGDAKAGANVAETVFKRITGMARHLIGLTLALFVGLVIWSLLQGGFDVNEFIQGIVVAVGTAVTTSAWVGAVEDATKA